MFHNHLIQLAHHSLTLVIQRNRKVNYIGSQLGHLQLNIWTGMNPIYVYAAAAVNLQM